MTHYFVYQYDTATGLITGVIHGDWPDNHKSLSLPDSIVLTSQIKAEMETIFDDGEKEMQPATIMGGGWAFDLENGVPKKDNDGKYVMIPPAIKEIH